MSMHEHSTLSRRLLVRPTRQMAAELTCMRGCCPKDAAMHCVSASSSSRDWSPGKPALA